MIVNQNTMINIDGDSHYYHLINYGHGIDTPGKRSPLLPDGRQLFEWRWVREVGNILQQQLIYQGINFAVINHEDEDVRLDVICARANDFAKNMNIKRIFHSIHANAAQYKYIDQQCTIRYNPNIHGNVDRFYYQSQWHPAHGIEAYTSFGDTGADPVAQIFMETANKMLPDWRLRVDRTDGDLDKESGFYVLRHTSMPAVLYELGFYTNREQVEYMLSDQGKMMFADILFRTIKRVENEKPL